MKTYRLGSAPMIYAPGLVAFAINGARFKKDRQQMINLIANGWGVPFGAAVKLVKGQVPYTIEDETVVFSVEAA
jgi:hypothetical protein